MRLVRMVVLMALAIVVGCKSGDGAPDPAAAKAQQDLMKRRDALLAERQRLESERQKIVEEIHKTEATGGDTKDLARKRDDLTAQIEGQSAELGEMSDKLSSLSTKLDTAAAIAMREDRIAQRETRVASREGQLGDREAQLGERERALADREDRLAQREKETCGAAPMIIQQVPARADGKYTKADVQPLLARARAAMAKKGVLVADLPEPAQGLEGESTRAMADGDWGKAYFAAAQLLAMVDSVKIDRAFIKAKLGRLSSQVTASKVDEATNQQLVGALSDVMQKYNDGNFGAANQRLNQLAMTLK
jgi:chromosome segregation ATPase